MLGVQGNQSVVMLSIFVIGQRKKDYGDRKKRCAIHEGIGCRHLWRTISPLVLEWEQRFICHGIQQGWKLLNWETMDEELVARVKKARLDFLQAPFELLVQQHFFAANGLAAFLHMWYPTYKDINISN